MNRRVIPRLDIKGPNLVKGIHFEGLRVLGKPEDYARVYYEQGADELIYVDTVASLYQRNSLVDIIQRTASEIFIPLTVGGGLRNIKDIRRVLNAGADKVAINTAAIKNPDFVQEAAEKFGSSTIVIDLQVVKNTDGQYEALTDYGRERTGKDPIRWAKQVEELGAGELLVTSINQEGTGRGYDTELVKDISDVVSIPVIASGGAGDVEDVVEVVREGDADAVCLASLLHYRYVKQMEYQESNFEEEGNIDFLMSGQDFSIIDDVSLPELKQALLNNNIGCRPVESLEEVEVT